MVSLPEFGLGHANLMSLQLPEFADVAARHGFHRISARPRSVETAAEQGLSEAALRRRLKDAGLQITMIDALSRDLPGVPSPDTFDEQIRSRLPSDFLNPADTDTCLRAASALEAPLLNVVAYMGKPVPVEQMAEAMSVICRKAKPHGVQVAIEFFPVSSIPDITTAKAVLAACGEPNCGILLDVFHLDRTDGTAADVRGLNPGSILAIQVSDRVRSAGKGYVPFQGRLLPGDGEIPIRELVHAALENNPDAVVEIEVLSEELAALPPDEAVDRLTASIAAFRAAF